MEKKVIMNVKDKRAHIKHKKYARTAIQIFFFLLMPGSFVAGFSGVKYLFQWIGAGEVIQVNGFIKALIGLLLFTVLFGRYFCGYVCAFGSFGDFVYFLSSNFQKKILKKKKVFKLDTKWILRLQKLKYLNLVCIIILCVLGIYSTLPKTSCWDVFSQLRVLKIPSGYIIGGISLLVVCVGMGIQERFFCQFLCPMGALFALLPMIGSLYRNESNCIKGCNACKNQCPVFLKIDEEEHRIGECIGCEKCVGICPKGNLKHLENRWIPNDIVTAFMKAGLFFILGFYLGF